jgi:hypothetical protein
MFGSNHGPATQGYAVNIRYGEISPHASYFHEGSGLPWKSRVKQNTYVGRGTVVYQ